MKNNNMSAQVGYVKFSFSFMYVSVYVCMSHQSDWSYYQGQEPIKSFLIKYEYLRLEIRFTAIFVFYI